MINFIEELPSRRQAESRSTAQFLDNLYSLCRDDMARKSMYYVHDHFDRWLCSGQTEKCSQVMAAAELDRLLPGAIVSFIASTTWAKDLPGRAEFLTRAKAHLADKLPPADLQDVFSRLA